DVPCSSSLSRPPSSPQSLYGFSVIVIHALEAVPPWTGSGRTARAVPQMRKPFVLSPVEARTSLRRMAKNHVESILEQGAVAFTKLQRTPLPFPSPPCVGQWRAVKPTPVCHIWQSVGDGPPTVCGVGLGGPDAGGSGWSAPDAQV